MGDLFGAFVIAEVNEPVFYTIMTILCILSSLFFLLLKQPKLVKQKDVNFIAEEVTLSSVFDLLRSKRMLKVIPLVITSGICIAGNAGTLVPLLIMTMKNTQSTVNWSSSKMS